MKTIILTIKDKVPGPPEAYPVALDVEGTVTSGSLLVAGLAEELRALLVDPGRFQARELGGDDPAGGGPSPNDEFARWLHDFAFGGDLKAAWNAVVKAGFRLVLDIAPADLRRLRWEQLGASPIYPARLPNCSVVRGKFRADATAEFRDGPIKLLVVVGSAKNDENVLAEEEVAVLQRTFADRGNEVDLKILRRPTRDRRPPENRSLTDDYLDFKPHVFHFIGHGKIDPAGGEPYLVLHDAANGQDVPWPLADIIGDLGQHVPEFVFLNACHSVDAAGRIESARAIWSMSDAFIEVLGVRAVLGMHAAVRGDAAGTLTAAFYEEILKGADLDLALTAARNRVDQIRGIMASRRWDWAIPYLRVCMPPDRVLGIAPPIDLCAQQAALVREFQYPLFVDREAQRREFLDRVQPDPGRLSNLLIVQGPSKVGKTELIRCCLRSAASRGRLVKYVELDTERKVDELGLLRLICEGDARSLIEKPLPDRAMARFYQTLNALLDGADPTDRTMLDSRSTRPSWGPLETPRKLPEKGGVQNQVKILFDAFLEALQEVPDAARADLVGKLRGADAYSAARILADPRPFLIVIDQVSQRGVKVESFQSLMVPHLIGEFAQGIKANVVLVLAVSEQEEQILGLDNLGVAPIRVRLPQFAPEEFETLALQYFDKLVQVKETHRGLDREEWKSAVREFSNRYKRRKTNFNPETFGNLINITFFPDSQAGG